MVFMFLFLLIKSPFNPCCFLLIPYRLFVDEDFSVGQNPHYLTIVPSHCCLNRHSITIKAASNHKYVMSPIPHLGSSPWYITMKNPHEKLKNHHQKSPSKSIAAMAAKSRSSDLATPRSQSHPRRTPGPWAHGPWCPDTGTRDLHQNNWVGLRLIMAISWD